MQLQTAQYSCVTADSNQNLTPSQKSILRWLGAWVSSPCPRSTGSPTMAFYVHQCPKLGNHTMFPCVLPVNTDNRLAVPLTALRPRYLFLNMVLSNATNWSLVMKSLVTNLGEIQQLGQLFRRRRKDHERYLDGTIFVDVATEFTCIYFQVTLSGSESIKSKHRIE